MMYLSTKVCLSADLRNLLDYYSADNFGRDRNKNFIEEWSAVNDVLNCLIDEGKEIAFVVKGKSEFVPLAEIQVFRYSDGYYGMSYGVMVGDGGLGSPFHGEAIASRGEAIAKGKRKILNYIEMVNKWYDGKVPAKEQRESKIVRAALLEVKQMTLI